MLPIEPRFIPRGDYQECLRLRGRANQILAILEQRMRLGNLKQLSMIVDIPTGGTIKCSNIFGARTIEIALPGYGGAMPIETVECICNCNFAEGYILELQEELLDDLVQLYTVMACVGDRYAMFRNVLASDFTLYEIGQKIMLIPYFGMSFLCCTGMFVSTGCSPKVSDFDLDHDDWRTSHRIIPWCALTIPKWVKRRTVADGNMR